VFSVGASGAVFGVVGALMGFLLPRGESVPKPFLSGLKRSGMTFLVYNVIIGLTIPRIDMAAHAGGFVAGVICGLLMSHPLNQVSAGTRRMRNLATTTLGMLGLALAIWQAPAPPADFRSGINALSDVEQLVEDTFDEAYERLGRGEISEREFARVLNEQVLRPWQAALADFNQLDSSDMTSEQQQAVVKLREYLQQQEQKWQTLAGVVTTLIQFSELETQAIAFSNEVSNKVQQGELSNADWAETIDSQILPPWKAQREQLEQSNFQLLPDRARQLAEKKTRYMRLREEAWQSLIVALRIDDEDMFQEYQEKTAAAEAIAAEVKAAQSAAPSE
jgi:hypothetical protein